MKTGRNRGTPGIRPPFFLFLFLLLPLLPAEAKEKIWHITEGEDASSTHHYFLHSDGEEITKIRWVWNGGSGNKPTVTEYLLDGGTIQVTKLTGERALIPALEAGKEPKMTVLNTYAVSVGRTDRMLIPQEGGSLSETQRIDLANLISILAKNRN